MSDIGIYGKKLYALKLILLSFSRVVSDSHSLRYNTIGVSGPGFGLPEFSIVGYVDDQQIEQYTSDIGRRIPVAEWMKKESPEYWESRTWSSKEREALFRQEMRLWKGIFNHARGFHFLQVMNNCELSDDGSIISYEHYRYDGEEYMYYDTTTGTFIPIMAEAKLTAQRWNKLDVEAWKGTKNYLENECIQRLKRFVEYGREELERRVQPGVKVTGQESGNITELHCLVYGFHPRPVDVKWMKNGIDDVPTDESTPVLPNPDGTYHIRVTAEVITKDGDSYSCYVDHSSLGEPLLVRWEPTEDCLLPVICSAVVLSAVVLAILLTVAIAGVLIYRRKKNNEMVAESSDTLSEPLSDGKP
ncbi:class I histocompatibility antigen, F10 alpha chain-like [Dendropsophus ebraccatus]|uniref:class I histocompatibility antigen, F10 alpha chain-like n=1 Tax=Dendropsophus ebraccatus TaxID=150705 RepID=UPI00383155F3